VIRGRKIVIGIIAGALSVLILLLAALLITPKVVDTKTVRDRLRSEIKEATGAGIDFEHLVLRFFPYPHIIFEQVVVSVPSVVKGKVRNLWVQPKILPLFLGKVQIAGLRLESADLDYILPKKRVTGKKRRSRSHILIWLEGSRPPSPACRNTKFRIWIFGLRTAA